MLTLTCLARADRHMLLNAGNDVQRWWRLVYTVLTGVVELLRAALVETGIHSSDRCGGAAACRHLWTMVHILLTFCL